MEITVLQHFESLVSFSIKPPDAHWCNGLLIAEFVASSFCSIFAKAAATSLWSLGGRSSISNEDKLWCLDLLEEELQSPFVGNCFVGDSSESLWRVRALWYGDWDSELSFESL